MVLSGPARRSPLKARRITAPDGRFIVYDHAQADTTASRDIYLLDLEGQRMEVLVEHPADDAASPGATGSSTE